jgi:hypothetical protein
VRLRHRQRAQITPLALYAVFVLVGALALVVDAGVFFVTQRQLQTAADAAALAAVWYTPVCSFTLDPDCEATAPAVPTPPAGWSCNATAADQVACAVLQQNLGYTGALCSDISPEPDGHLDRPSNGTTYYVLTVNCDAPYWFARIFPSIPATVHLRVFARATVGYPTPTGVTRDNPNAPNPPPPLVSRLVS